jgi:hypothetical protein
MSKNPSYTALLTLIGMRGDTFISLSFLDQILSAEFLSKRSKLFGLTSGYFDTLSSYLSFRNCPYAKDGHFSFFQRSCQFRVNTGYSFLRSIAQFFAQIYMNCFVSS